MSAQPRDIKIVRRDQRLRVTAQFSHQTTQYGGNVFEFLEMLMREQRTGIATVRLNRGKEYSLEFDLRETIPLDIDEKPV